MEAECACPYCGELISLWLEAQAGRSQRYVEDCSVCCRPIQVHVQVDDDGEPALYASRLDG